MTTIYVNPTEIPGNDVPVNILKYDTISIQFNNTNLKLSELEYAVNLQYTNPSKNFYDPSSSVLMKRMTLSCNGNNVDDYYSFNSIVNVDYLKNAVLSKLGFTETIPPETQWLSTITYTTMNIVSYSGNIYTSIQDSNINNEPDISPTWWILNYPEWSSTITYNVDNIVIYNKDLYLCVTQNIDEQPDISPDYWIQYFA
jgi:hypothetical protein